MSIVTINGKAYDGPMGCAIAAMVCVFVGCVLAFVGAMLLAPIWIMGLITWAIASLVT